MFFMSNVYVLNHKKTVLCIECLAAACVYLKGKIMQFWLFLVEQL